MLQIPRIGEIVVGDMRPHARWRAVAAALLAVALVSGASPSYADSTISSTPDERAGAAARARGVALTLTGPRQVAAGETVVLTGRVRTADGGTRRARVVRVAERRDGRWVVVGKARSTQRGGYRISFGAGAVAGHRVFRAQAPAVRRLPAVRTGRLSVRVVASDVASPDDWTFLMDGGSRWNPCEPITWSYNPTGEPYDALPDVTAAFSKIAGASGLTFRYAGPTPLIYLGLPGGLAGGADITVGWANPTLLSDLVGSVVGLGGALGTKVTGHDVTWKLTQGWVTLDNADPLRPKPGFGASSFGQVLLHETLHVLGLGHAEQPTQLMYPVASGQNTTFGAGDRAGIARIGAAPGCL